MDFAFTPEDEAFRAELREWLETNVAEFNAQGEIGSGTGEGILRTMERRKAWQRTLNEGRWAAINWPKEWGGRDAIANGRKHEGITALIVDMHTPGVECRPIREITGDAMFNEVFFTDARVPVANRLGEEGQGWQVAMGTLGHERVGTSGLSITMKIELDNMIAAARKHNPEALDDPELRERIARTWTQLELTRLLNARALSKVLKGEKSWPEVQLAKLQWSWLSQYLAELGVDLLGPAGLLAKDGPDAVDGGVWNRNYVWQRYTSIGAGTTEVQKNIIADRAIQLPRKTEGSGG